MRRKYAAIWNASAVIFAFIYASLFGNSDGENLFGNFDSPLSLCLSLILYAYLFFVGIIINIKRLHDINYSGWWILPINILSIFLFSIPLIILLCWPGTKGSNDYGEDPRWENDESVDKI